MMNAKHETPASTVLDPDVHKGAVESDRPEDRRPGNRHGGGVDAEGLPDDPIAQAEDEIGANADKTQG